MRKEEHEKYKHDELVDFAFPMIKKAKDSWRAIVAAIALITLIIVAIFVKTNLDERRHTEMKKDFNKFYYQYSEFADSGQSGDFSRLIDEILRFKKTADDDAILASTNVILGNCYMRTKEYANAIKAFQESLKNSSKPKSRAGSINMLIAHAYQEDGKYSEAISYYEKATKIFPSFEKEAQRHIVTCKNKLAAPTKVADSK